MKQSLLIRALILVSVALLVAGALAPLLTTERFYFFSNTFSLLSGLQQLVANGQLLIAVVIGFFSLCVPVVKAVVIWLAASGHASSRPLLVIADRFGKWSMLEVFVAALLIISIKLGPIADATLHYGVWLLAASVLCSGAASQLLEHERHHGPIFSSPVTLTLGAVGGALAATLLIGLLNPGLLSFDAIVGTPETRCIQRAFRLDQFYAASGSTQSEFVDNLQLINLEACPEDFREAFAAYTDAWQQLEEIDASGDEEPSLLSRAGALVGLIATREDVLEEIEATWAEIARIAEERGIDVPDR
jgi:paraquat-inducible protein A